MQAFPLLLEKFYLTPRPKKGYHFNDVKKIFPKKRRTFMDVYNKNRDKNQSLSDEIREQNAKLKDASLKEKLLYFKDYYLLTTIIVIAVCAFLGSLGYTMLTAPRDTALGVFFYNDTGDSSDTGLIDGFAGYMGIDTSKQSVFLDASMSYCADFSDLDAYAGLEKAMASITASDLDIIVGDATTVDYFTQCNCIGDITTILPEDLLKTFEEHLYYAETGEGDKIAAGIDISDAPKLKEHYYDMDKTAILSFVINSDKIDNVIAFLQYLYMKT